LIRAWNRWVRAIEVRETGEALACFRILTGVALLLALGSVMVAGIVDVLWIDRAYGGYRELAPTPWLSDALGGATPGVIWSIVFATLLSGLALTAGIGSRVAALVAAQGMLALSMINPDAKGSYDALLSNALWLLVLARSDATLSLRCRWRSGSWTSDERVAAWPRRLAILQLVIVYTGGALHKVSAAWTPAGGWSALYYILQQPSWQRWDMQWLAWVYPLTQAATATVWLWEISWVLVPIWMWARSAEKPGRFFRVMKRIPVRRGYVALGVVFHTGIWIAMDVGPFIWITLAFYPCLWRPEELRTAWAKLRGRLAPSLARS
jgi:hypothetical protein